VTAAGEPEAAEQLDLDARGLRELTVGGDALGEALRARIGPTVCELDGRCRS